MNRAAAIKTIEACKVTHQLWIDYWGRHSEGRCACGDNHVYQVRLVGSKAHHEGVNAEYDNVLDVLRSKR